jgi:hypothetical protein
MTSSEQRRAQWAEYFDFYESIGACLLPVDGPKKSPMNAWGAEASTDRAQWEASLEQFAYLGERLGFAMATGKKSGIDVLDLDLKHGDVELLLKQAEELVGSPIPETLSVRSGGGGLHFYFRHNPARPIKTGNGIAGPGIDTRGNGGIIIIPRTLHKSGNWYDWQSKSDPAVSDWLADLQKACTTKTRPAPHGSATAPGTAEDTVRTLRMVPISVDERPRNFFDQRQQDDWRRIESALMSLDADCSYQHWIEIAFALDSSGHPAARELWVTWSATASSKFEGREATETKWDRYIAGKTRDRDGESKVSVGTLFHHARHAGWTGINPTGNPGAPGGGSGASTGTVGSPSAPKTICVATGDGKRDLADLGGEAAAALCGLAEVFIRHGAFVKVTRTEGVFALTSLTDASMTLELCRAAVWYDYSNKRGFYRIEGPSPRLVNIVLTLASEAEDIPGARVIRHLAFTPFMMPSGTVFEGPGDEPSTGTLLAPNPIRLRLPDFPTGVDPKIAAQACYARIVAHFDEVPFSAEEHRAAMVALLLTLVSRPLLGDAPTPMFLVNANTSGAGKTRLLKSAVICATGMSPHMGPLPLKEEELQKVVFAEARHGPDCIVFDNVASTLGGPAIESAITSGALNGRLLGTSEMKRCNLRATWIASGNNCEVTRDMAPRCIEIYLDAQSAEPRETRFRISEDDWWETYLPERRSEIVSDLLGLLMAHRLAGSPPLPRPMGSFGAWASHIGAAVFYASGANPVDTQVRLRDMSDRETESLKALCAVWEPTYRFTAAELLKIAQFGSLDAVSLGDGQYAELRTALEPFASAAGRLQSVIGLSKTLAKFHLRAVRLPEGTAARLCHLKDNKGTKRFVMQRQTTNGDWVEQQQ